MVVQCFELGNKLIMLSDSTASFERPGHMRVEKKHQLKFKRVKNHKAGKNTNGRHSDHEQGKRKAIVSLKCLIWKAGVEARVQEAEQRKRKSFAFPLLLRTGFGII